MCVVIMGNCSTDKMGNNTIEQDPPTCAQSKNLYKDTSCILFITEHVNQKILILER